MEVAGVDGCEDGWLVVRAEALDRLRIRQKPCVNADFAQVLAETMDCAAVAIDVPIGLMDAGTRSADAEARRLLKSRHSCVFPSAIRPVLGITDYYEACNVSFQAQGKRIPPRAFALGKRSYEVDHLMTLDLQRRIVEVHPEICFWALNEEQPVLEPKRTPDGESHRLHLLGAAFSGDVSTLKTPKGAARDDLLDACAAAWSAWRFATGQHKTLPEKPPTDRRGLRMEIVY